MITELKVSRSGLQGRMFPVCFSVLAAALVCLSASAHASNLVADSGFEAAGGGNVYFAGQSIDGGSWNVTQGAIYIDTQHPWVSTATTQPISALRTITRRTRSRRR